MKKVHVEEKPGLSDREAELTIQLRNGKSLTHRVYFPLGDPENPLTDQQLEEKTRNLLAPVFPKERIDLVLEKIWAFESIENIAGFTPLLKE